MAKKMMISCDEMVKKVTEAFIIGADEKFLKKIEKTAKGGGVTNDFGTALSSKDNKYALAVLAPFFFFMKSKEVLFQEKDTKVEYTMPKKEWPKFYQAIKDAVAKEKAK
ncbi:MAG: hypothetical protein IJW49_02365 [Clostridia bacterium]|nr:hypothetical protein [Clostridia bacterium]